MINIKHNTITIKGENKMKTKKFDKKMVIKKVTISNLDFKELIKIHGGGTVFTARCEPSCDVKTVVPPCD